MNNEKQWFKECLQNTKLIESLKKIKLIITDVDGCLTDGSVSYSSYTEITKSFSVQDGFVMSKCNKPNMPHLAIITGRTDIAMTKRAQKLGIPQELYHQGEDQDKSHAVTAIQKHLHVTSEETLYFGDDYLDLAVNHTANIFSCPMNALFYVQRKAEITVPRRGGDGAFRLLLDLLLYVQNKHFAKQFIKDALQ